MGPLVTQAECLGCHAAQGYREGDIRGGISVSVPLAPLKAAARDQTVALWTGHGLLWLTGLAGIVLGGRRLGRREGQVLHLLGTVRQDKEELETRVRQRTEELDKTAEELRALNRLGRRVATGLSLDHIALAAVEEVKSALAVDLALLYRLQGRSCVLLGLHSAHAAVCVEDFRSSGVEECLCGLAASRGEPVYSLDLHRDPRVTREECRRAGMRSFAALPLLHEGEVLGVLGVATLERRDFAARAVFLEALASRVALAMENALLYEKLSDSARELERRVEERTAELAQATRAAEQANAAKSIFLATMSHELRTPLNSILGFIGVILREMSGPLIEEQRKQLDIVRTSARHLLDLINDILDISKIEAGELRVAAEPFEMSEAIGKVVQTLLPAARRKGLTLTAVVAPEVGRVVSDRRRVEQVLLNLVGNAVKFTEEGWVRVECRAVNGRLETRVLDTGIGIKPEHMARLFVKFQQLETGLDRPSEGTGLGLAISKKLVELLGGEIRAESRWGAGSVFSFTLPVEKGGEDGATDSGHRG